MKQVNDNYGCLGFLFYLVLGLPIMSVVFFGQQFYISYLRLFKGLTVKRHKTSYYDFGELRISQPKNNSEKQDNQFMGGAILIPIGGFIAYVILLIIYAQIEKALRI